MRAYAAPSQAVTFHAFDCRSDAIPLQMASSTIAGSLSTHAIDLDSPTNKLLVRLELDVVSVVPDNMPVPSISQRFRKRSNPEESVTGLPLYKATDVVFFEERGVTLFLYPKFTPEYGGGYSFSAFLYISISIHRLLRPETSYTFSCNDAIRLGLLNT